MYRRRASPLHAARATTGALFCIAGATFGGVVPNPIVTAAVALAAFGVAFASGVGHDVTRSLRLSVPLALVLVVVNVLVVRRGLTVFARLGEVPPFGQVDLTVEALVAGGLVALHVVAVMAWASVFACCVNPDGLLDAFRRLSFRSALSATLATRLIPSSRATRSASPRPSAADPSSAAPPERARRSCARWRPARWTARSTWRPRSRCAATRSRGGRRAGAARARATTLRCSPPRPGSWR
jgi:energy-coupling factor transport system permease protein